MDFARLMSQLAPQLAEQPVPMAGADPSALPSPAPMAAAPMAPPPPSQPKPRPKDLLLQLAPLVLSMFTARKDPFASAGLLQGMIRGNEIAQRQHVEAQERKREQKLAAAKLMQQAGADAARFATPEEAANYLAFAEQFIREIDPELPQGHLGRTVPIPVASMNQRRADADRKAAADKVEEILKLYGPEAAQATEVTFRGKRMPFSALVQLAELGAQGPAGPLAPPVKAEKPPNKQYQSKEMLVDGKVEVVGYDPDTNLYYRPGDSQPLRNVRPVPDKPTGGGKGISGDAQLVEAVINHPALWDNLTPTVRSRIGPALAAKGFANFGRPMGDTAIEKLSDGRSAVASLRDLRDVLSKNEQYIGPVAGLSGLNPYSPARKAQADINRVRQRVGKALEGGVLRKEDEEKYKKILATLTDEPTTAIYKVDQMIAEIERDIATFEDEQQRAGRRVTPPKGSNNSGTATSGGQKKIGRFIVEPH